ncbi:MAG: hypothetical protein ACP5OG_05275 [Candidatus Nanoarchaeia archaeon]
MAELEYKNYSVNIIDSRDFDKFVKETYNQNYFFQHDECMNGDLGYPCDDFIKLYTGISGKLNSKQLIALNLFKTKGEYRFISRILLEDLCKNKHIGPGNYLINVVCDYE